MCLSAILTGLGAASAVKGSVDANKARKEAKAQAAGAEQARIDAETKAMQSAQNRTIMQRKAMKDNSLFTGAGDAGRATLGV
jgi:hypothetical protein